MKLSLEQLVGGEDVSVLKLGSRHDEMQLLLSTGGTGCPPTSSNFTVSSLSGTNPLEKW
jgi:hypothetical protein